MRCKMRYWLNCVNWPRRWVPKLHAMVDDAVEVTRRTFLKHVNRRDLERIKREIGYAPSRRQGMVMADDSYVRYYRSKVDGETVYFLTWSAIVYVFRRDDSAK